MFYTKTGEFDLYDGPYGAVPAKLFEIDFSYIPWVYIEEDHLIKVVMAYWMSFNSNNSDKEPLGFYDLSRLLGIRQDNYAKLLLKMRRIGLIQFKSTGDEDDFDTFLNEIPDIPIRTTPNLIDTKLFSMQYERDTYEFYGRDMDYEYHIKRRV